VTGKTAQGGTFLKPKHPVRTEECRPVSEILARIGDKWSVLVVNLLGKGPLRFSALRKMIDGISQKMLTTTLRSLERDGFVIRTVFPTGKDLLVPVVALAEWAHKNQPRMDEARRAFDARQARSSNGARPAPLPVQLRP
jgi:DNA-binding HxlR family transcriptional regulator